eukprot:scaffold189665_cov28-Tisochrysis_lutea.AAC.1
MADKGAKGKSPEKAKALYCNAHGNISAIRTSSGRHYLTNASIRLQMQKLWLQHRETGSIPRTNERRPEDRHTSDCGTT